MAESAAAWRAAELPGMDSVLGPLAIRVVYPVAGSVVDATDSSFMFGSTGHGAAALTINGAPVPVAPNGAWLAWVALPPDSMMRFELVARTGTDTARSVLEVRRPTRFRAPGRAAWVDTTAFSPRGSVAWPASEPLPLRVRAAPGATVSLRLPDSTTIALAPDVRPDDVPWGIRAFDRDTTKLARQRPDDRYIGALRDVVLDSLRRAELVVIAGADTARAWWPLHLMPADSLPAVVELDDDTARRGTTDGITIGRALPGGTYHWFWPAGTRAATAGRINGDLRLQLAPGIHAWVPAADAQPVAGAVAPRAVVGSLTMTPDSAGVTVRIPLSERVPFEVLEREAGLDVVLFGAVGDVNWIRYGAASGFVERATWTQGDARGVRLSFDLAAPVWGFRTRWDRGDLLLQIRRPPDLARGNPFSGLRVVVDAGHPPLGATGPTGYTEAEANLAISLVLQRLLEEAGAHVIMTRTDATPVDLGARPRLADSVDAHLLVSVHNNALPDGVNPFPNNGSSVFYNHPRSIPLARFVQARLAEQLGVRDLGVARGDLALVRPTWMPAILTEGLFMMVPAQEAALRSPGGQRRYAEAVFEGMRDFLRWRAR